ncbi:MAG: DUF1573 domain-containing protein [Bacteroidota bacterium]
MVKAILLLSLSIYFLLSDTTIVWSDGTEYDFETLVQGKPKAHLFQFKNKHSEPIFIETIRTTCGCTAPEWEATPILPDSTGSIKILYDAQRTGYFRKKIRVFFSHQRKAELLFIEGFVE